MRPPHIICECGEEFLWGGGYKKHVRERHGFIIVRLSSGGDKYVPIMSHPEHAS